MAGRGTAVAVGVVIAGAALVLLLDLSAPEAPQAPPRGDEPAERTDPPPEQDPAPGPDESTAEEDSGDEPPTPPADPLGTRLSFDFAGADVGEVLGWIAKVAQLELSLEPAVSARLEKIPVTLKMMDIPARAALDTLLRITGDGFEYSVENGVLVIR